MQIKMMLGKRIKELRHTMGVSQEAFAELMGIHRNTVAKLENGKLFVSPANLDKLVQIFKIDYKDLFTFNKPVDITPQRKLEAHLERLNAKEADYFINCINEYLKLKD